MSDGVQTPPEQDPDRAAVQGVVFHDDYELTILLEADGRLRRLVHSSGVDGAEAFTPGSATVVSVARYGSGGDSRADAWAERLARLQSTMTPVHYRTTPPGAAPGQPETVECVATPIAGPDGTLDSILLQAYDRTTTHRVEEQLRESEARFRLLAESLPQMVWVAGADGDITYFAPQWEQFTGRTQEQLLGDGFFDLIHPDDRGMLREQRGTAEEFTLTTFRLLRADGVYRWVEAGYRTLYDDLGTPIRWVGATTDVTDRLEAESEARELQEQLRVALAVTRMGRYALYFAESRITGDSRLSEILGVDVYALMDREGLDGLFAMVHAEDVSYVQRAVETAAAGGPDYDVEYRMWRPTDQGAGAAELRWVGARGRVEFDAEGTAIRMLGVVEDITERRAEEEARLRWQKREAIGSLAGGVAHDFNNVVSAILSNASLAETELRLGISPQTSISEIARGAERASEITRRLLAFSREEADDDARAGAPFEVGGVVEEACALVDSSLPPTTRLIRAITPGLPLVTGHADDLHRVVVNLLTNAGHATEGSEGTITATVDLVHATQEGAAPVVRIRVEDSGHGIPEAILTRVFDPFFTTKPAGRGTGLGLAAAQSIVRDHGGSIEAENVPGAGARFTVLLPALVPRGAATTTPGVPSSTGSPAPAPAPAPAVLATPGPPQTRVLFVDDEAPLARLAERALPTFGFAVEVFTDPVAALAAVEADPAAFDALITDLSMPGLSGLELIERARAVRADLPVVLSSGFLTAANRRTADQLGVDAIVPKPCSIDMLAKELAAAIRGDATGSRS